MSYNICIYHPTVKKKMEEGLEMDAFKHPPLASVDVERFLDRLGKYGYELENQNACTKEFVKSVSGCPITVSIYPTEIAFLIPYWKNSESAILEARKDAAELADSDSMALFDQQTVGWVE